jgi:hypothetical protein
MVFQDIYSLTLHISLACSSTFVLEMDQRFIYKLKTVHQHPKAIDEVFSHTRSDTQES